MYLQQRMSMHNNLNLLFQCFNFIFLNQINNVNIIHDTITSDKKDDDYVCKDNFRMEVDANSLTAKSLRRSVI